MNKRICLSLGLVALLGTSSLSCDGQFVAPLPDRSGLFYPIGMELHPNGRFLYVVNSNFNLRYREEQGGMVSVIDTETFEVLENSSPYLASFGGKIALNEDATRAYVTSRHNNEVTILDVAPNGGALFCGASQLADTQSCQVRRLPDVRDGARIPDDPFGIAVTTLNREIDGALQNFDILHLSHLRGEQVTALSLPEGRPSGGSLRSAALLAGGNQLVRRPGTEDIYVAPRNTNFIGIFRPFINDSGEVEAIVRRGTIPLTRRNEVVDARGLTFDESGDTLFVATRRPSALHIIDMTAGPNETPRVVSSLPLEARSSEVIYHRGADGVARLYIPSYRQGLIEVIDVEREAIVDTIHIGRSPYDMVVQTTPRHCTAPGERCLGFVSLFDDRGDGQRCDDEGAHCGTVAVLDLDPASETFHTVIETIR